MGDTAVFIVDDHKMIREGLKAMIAIEPGLKVVGEAASGEDALDAYLDICPDVVILDVKMPGIDGVAVLRKTKQKHPLVEVIMLTGHASVESAVEGLKLGAFDYVKKPCDISDLIAKVNEAHDKKHAMEEKIRKAQIDKIIRHPMAVFEKEE